MRNKKNLFLTRIYYLIGVSISTFLITRMQYLWAALVLLLFYFVARLFGKISSKRRFDAAVMGLLHLGSGEVPRSFIVQYLVNSTTKTDFGKLEHLVQSSIERLEKKGYIEVQGEGIRRIS
jgi:hypothetical protein